MEKGRQRKREREERERDGGKLKKTLERQRDGEKDYRKGHRSYWL